MLRQFDTEVQRSEYTDVTTLTVGVRRSEVDAFVEAFTNALSDGGELLRVGSWGLRTCFASQIMRRSIKRDIPSRIIDSEVSGWYS